MGGTEESSVRRCYVCGVEVGDTICRCGKNKHQPLCDACAPGEWDRRMKKIMDAHADALMKHIEDEVFRKSENDR